MKKSFRRSLSCLSLLIGVSVAHTGLMPAGPAYAQDTGTVSAIGPIPEATVPSEQGEGTAEINPSLPAPVASSDEETIILSPEPVDPAQIPATQSAVPVESEAAIVSEGAPQPPPSEPLASAASGAQPPSENALPPSPTIDGGLVPLPEEAQGAVDGTNVMGDSGAPQQHSGTFYDSRAIVPDSELSSSGATGPRKVDPAYEPGQKYIIVEPGPKAGSFEGQYVAAVRALKLGRYAAAMEMFEKLYKRNHKDPRILMGLAVAQQGAGFSQSAAQTYEDLLKLQPNNADAIVNLMGIMKSQYPSVTLKKLMELRNKYPSNPGIPAQIGLVSAELQNYDDAIRYFEVAASMEPTNPSHIFNMAVVVDKKGDVSQAIKLYERALQLDATYGSSANNLSREQIYDRLVVLRRKV